MTKATFRFSGNTMLRRSIMMFNDLLRFYRFSIRKNNTTTSTPRTAPITYIARAVHASSLVKFSCSFSSAGRLAAVDQNAPQLGLVTIPTDR
jgi:hypothetical protein